MLSPALGYALSYAFTPFLQPANQRQISSFLPFKRRQDAVTLRVHANVRASELETKARDKFLRFFSLCSVTAFLSGWCHFRRLKTMMCSNWVPRRRSLFRKKMWRALCCEYAHLLELRDWLKSFAYLEPG